MARELTAIQIKAFYKGADFNRLNPQKVYSDSSHTPYSKAFCKLQNKIFDDRLAEQLAADDLENYDPEKG